MRRFRCALRSTQRFTVSERLHFCGVALHVGGESALALEPHDDGIRWRMAGRDLGTPCHIHVDNHTTVLRFDCGARILCVEHLLCALWLAGITDVVIDLRRGTELPLMDGSASVFFTAITARRQSLGISKLPIVEAATRTVFTDHSTGASIAIEPAPSFGAVARIRYGAPIGEVAHDFRLPMGVDTLVRARTFIRDPIDRIPVAEVASTRLRGLHRACRDDAVVLWDRSGITGPLRFPTELAAHKVVDFIGDLYAYGIRPCFLASLEHSGHRLNHEASREIRGLTELRA